MSKDELAETKQARIYWRKMSVDLSEQLAASQEREAKLKKTLEVLRTLLQQAEEALNYYDFANGVPQKALTAIQKWKEQV